jgi:hypothetical protein
MEFIGRKPASISTTLVLSGALALDACGSPKDGTTPTVPESSDDLMISDCKIIGTHAMLGTGETEPPADACAFAGATREQLIKMGQVTVAEGNGWVLRDNDMVCVSWPIVPQGESSRIYIAYAYMHLNSSPSVIVGPLKGPLPKDTKTQTVSIKHKDGRFVADVIAANTRLPDTPIASRMDGFVNCSSPTPT